jgi:hypothetical protein
MRFHEGIMGALDFSSYVSRSAEKALGAHGEGEANIGPLPTWPDNKFPQGIAGV